MSEPRAGNNTRRPTRRKDAARKNAKLSNRQHIMARYGGIVLLFLTLCTAIIVKLAYNTMVEAPGWNKRAAEDMAKTRPVEPARGSILSAGGNILACNQTLYNVRIDMRHPRLTKIKPRTWAALDSLADSLDFYYPRTRAFSDYPRPDHPDSWHTLMHKQFNMPRRADRIKTATIGNKLTEEQWEQIRRFPFFKEFKGENSKTPLYRDPMVVRVYPFGDMARLSIGRVYEDSTGRVRGYAGLEMALDSLLHGVPGLEQATPLNTGMAGVMKVPPKRGYDILTTIDIDIQDILEEELLKMCDSVRAEWGTAIIMEVKTGEIKAISNVERDSTGRYVEAMNRAVQAFEPGSVMKPISLMIALEDGLVHRPTDMVDCSPFMQTEDHAGGGMKSMKEVIETSSNPGIARVIFRGYDKDPAAFRKRLATIGFFEPMNSGIGGETTPRVPRLDPTQNGRPVTMLARHLSLARQAYGYNTEIPPLYTLSYYNAIANKGKYVRPHLVRALRDEQGRDSLLPLTYIRDSVCSSVHAAMVKECLHEVVWGKRGTGRSLQDDRVEIVGKTGTAYPYDYKVLKAYDKSKRRYAFAGFYPYDNPKYSCMVLITADAGATSAARSSGRVLLNTALKLYARGLLSDTPSSYSSQPRTEGTALLYGTDPRTAGTLVSGLQMQGAKRIRTAPAHTKGTVPDVTGMDAATAIAALEGAGVDVERINGSGYVRVQSLQPGQRVRKGMKCSLWLEWNKKKNT